MAAARSLSEILPKEMTELRVRPLFILLLDVRRRSMSAKRPASIGASASSPAAGSRANVCAARCCPAAAIGSRCAMATARG